MQDLYWIEASIPGRLAIMSRPRGGDWLSDDLRRIRRAGVVVLGSLLEPLELAELDLDSLSTSCDEAGIELRSFPIPDRGLPASMAEARDFVTALNDALGAGAGVAVHCRMGIGRSSLIAAAILVTRGLTVADAFSRIQRARGLPVPDTDAQVRWVEQYASQFPLTNAGS